MNFIETFFINDLNICDDIIDHFKSLPKESKYNGVSYGHDVYGNIIEVYDKDTKDSIDAEFYGDTEVAAKYAEELTKCMNAYVQKYPECNQTKEWGIVEPVLIQYYKPGGGYKKYHCERSSSNNNRHLVFMTYLNNVTEGGETEFKLQNLKIKAEKGKTVIWPSDWTHTHRGIVSNTQEKYIITGWYSFIK